jgi:hypothetical protein
LLKQEIGVSGNWNDDDEETVVMLEGQRRKVRLRL